MLEYITKADGKLTLFQQEEKQNFYHRNEGKKILHKMSVYQSKRTLHENDYLHLICRALHKLTGHSMEYFKEMNKKIFFPKIPGIEVIIRNEGPEGEEIKIRKLSVDGEEKPYSSTSLDAVRFYDWLELIRDFWNLKFKEQQFYIMTPEQYYNKLRS